MFATASGFRLAALRCLILPPPLSAGALVKALALHILEQTGLGDLATELLQDVVQSVAVAYHHLHCRPLFPGREPPRNDKRPRALAQVLGTVSGVARANDRRAGAICQPRRATPNTGGGYAWAPQRAARRVGLSRVSR